MGQKADHFGWFFAWVKKPTILGGSSHGSKSRLFWGVFGYRYGRIGGFRFRSDSAPPNRGSNAPGNNGWGDVSTMSLRTAQKHLDPALLLARGWGDVPRGRVQGM